MEDGKLIFVESWNSSVFSGKNLMRQMKTLQSKNSFHRKLSYSTQKRIHLLILKSFWCNFSEKSLKLDFFLAMLKCLNKGIEIA